MIITMPLSTNIIALACLCVIMSRYVYPPIVSFILKVDSRSRDAVKPWECGFCLSWWMGCAVWVYQFGIWGVAYAAMTAVCGAFIDRYL